MVRSILTTVKPFLPKFAIKIYRALFVTPIWRGKYPSWEAAESQCTGYGKNEILEKVVAAALTVKEGRAAYERDSVIFYEEKFYLPFVMALESAQEGFPSLSIIDFGGSLGSTYYQHLKLFKEKPEIKWNIVEQAHYVEKGKDLFSSEQLNFYWKIDEIPLVKNELLTLLSVLPYLPLPWAFLDDVLKRRRPRSVFIDRTYFSYNDKDRITIQTVPPSIYRASYPCWFLSKTKLTNLLQKYGYEEVASFDCEGQSDIPAAHKGFLFKLKS